MSESKPETIPTGELKARLAACDRPINSTPTTEHHTPKLMAARREQERLFWELIKRGERSW